jgi:hypothetical protein
MAVICEEFMNKETMEDLLFSLAWFDASSHHNQNVKNILSREYHGEDFSKTLEEFVKCKTMPPGEGCPR